MARYSPYHTTSSGWNGFITTGIWVGLKLFILPLALFTVFTLYSNNVAKMMPGKGSIMSGGLGSVGPSLQHSLDQLGKAGRLLDDINHRSNGAHPGFAVGPAPVSPGAKWVRP